MAATRASSVKVHRNTRCFVTVLTSAVCEWILIFMLFIDALLSYFLTKFASYYKLQTPCLLCSRLDHVLGNEKPEFYWTLLCSSHKSEISSLIYCQIHGKLADGHGMCEDCLLSFATKNKAISESHRLFGAELGFDLVSGSNVTRPCSCCNKLWSSKQHAHRSFQLKSTGSGATKPNIPLPRLPGRNRLNRRDSLKRIRAKFYGSVTSQRLGSSGFNPLSEVGYTELKITSDSESEVPVSDDDDGSSMVREKNDFKQDISIQHASEVLPKSSFDDLAPVKQDQSVNPGPSLLEPFIQCDVSESHDVKCLTSDGSIGHGLSELKWQQSDQEFNPLALPELLSVNDILPSSNVVEVHSPALHELIYFDDFPPSVNIVEAPVGESLKNHLSGIDHVGPSVHAEVLISTNGEEFKSDHVSDDLIISKLDYVDLCISTKSVVNNMGREASSSFAQVSIKDPDKVNLKLLHSEIPFGQAIDLSSNNTSPRVQGHDDELQITDASSSNGVKMLQKSYSADRDEPGLESLDGSAISEIDGESVVDRLKRQVEYDQKCMSSLSKELEEERNASTVAADQAMAMITRLQEEKAALHMEALQYLRMMEEQAEYDVEALEKANDLLAEKDKEMQDLEAELELYRNQYTDDSTVDNIPEDTCNVKRENMMVENTPTNCFKDISGISTKSMTSEAFKDDDKPCEAKTSLLEFEDEKVYISRCLKKLERKLHGVSDNRASMDMPNGGYYDKVANRVNNHEEFLYDEGTQIDHSMEENGVSMLNVLSISNGSLFSQGGCIASVGDNHSVGQENNHVDSDGQKSCIHLRHVDLVALENEVSDLNDRLEALESNHDFLEHAFNTLQNGKEGLQFIQEITHQLQELKNIGLRQRCQFVP